MPKERIRMVHRPMDSQDGAAHSNVTDEAAGTATVVVGGDLCPTGRNAEAFRNGDAVAIFGDLLESFRSADLAIANLECPLITEPSPIEQPGPVLGEDVVCIRGIREAGIGLVGLANNHIMDHGIRGLRTTLQTCAAAGLDTVGAGEDIAAARTVRVKRVRGIRIGVLAMAEREFSIAGRSRGGANPLDPIDFVRNVRESRHAWDYLIVLLHGGNEDYPYPRPSLMEACRFLAEEGAGAVVCQHSHCPGCFETHQDAHIVYGQGNLIFDWGPGRSNAWHEGFLVVLRVGRGTVKMEIIPYRQSDSRPGARRMEGRQEHAFRAALKTRSESITDPTFVERQWDRFCLGQRSRYLALLCTNNSLSRALAGRFPVLQRLYSKRSLRLKLNLIRCESHRDVLTRVLSKE